ncbi:MAG: SCP2 sterol-binding domain-containing protein [Gammaproteobacteria bacterium]|nr:SCP2 sterol-binding domain-containing protein [Gammaproteobacteria bacterium]
MSISTFGYASLEALLNSYLALDPVAREELAQLHGRTIALELTGVGLRLYLLPAPDGIKLLERFEGEPDCLLRGTPLALARMRDRRTSTKQLFSGEVVISGDTETAHRFAKVLGAIDIDWEEQLSKVTGDLIAHKVGNLFRAAGDWGVRARDTLAADADEYLKEELRLLPDRRELRRFLDDVDRLRDDAERMQARFVLLRERQERRQ